MVQEYRKIILSTDELVAALESYRRIMPTFMPEGRIAHCIVFEYGVVKVTLETGYGEKTRQSYLALQAVDVLKPVIGFCIEHKIMLPKEGRKSIEIQRGSVVLRVELSMKIQLPGHAPAQESAEKLASPAPVADQAAGAPA